MSSLTRSLVPACLLLALLVSGCKSRDEVIQAAGAEATAAKASSESPKLDTDGAIASLQGVEREKPAPGKGNVQGKVLYNEKPAVGVEVKLCETFSRFVGGCGGAEFTAKTDANGEYLIKNVPPKVYESLMVRVFDSDYYVFASSGILQAAKYKIEPGRTFFAPHSSLFKQDLKLITPKAGSKMAGSGIEVAWKPYPDADHYKFSIHPNSTTGVPVNYDYINKRVDATSHELDQPLAPGSYRCSVEAYNANDVKLAESAKDIEFTVK
jgi:hypothetical protein